MRRRTCTTSGPTPTAVSYTVGTGIDGAILNVRSLRLCATEEQARRIGADSARAFYLGGRTVAVKADHDGRTFDSSDEAAAFALEHGYLEEFFTSPDLRARRVQRAVNPRK